MIIHFFENLLMLFLINSAEINVELNVIEIVGSHCFIVVFRTCRNLCFFLLWFHGFSLINVIYVISQFYFNLKIKRSLNGKYIKIIPEFLPLFFLLIKSMGAFSVLFIISLIANLKIKMMEENRSQDNLNNESRMSASRLKAKKKANSKLSKYQTNLENFMANEKSAIEKINPKGIIADAIYVSFSGVIESAELFLRQNEDFQVSYHIKYGQQWHDETPDVRDLDGVSPFCEAKNGIIHFSLDFDCLLSCVFIQSWPQLIMTIKGFSPNGEIITKGYAQIHLSVESGQKIKETNIFSIHKEERWFERLFRFFQPNPLALDEKDFQRIIAKGEGREVEKIKTIGKIRIRTETLKRNYGKFGYK